MVSKTDPRWGGGEDETLRGREGFRSGPTSLIGVRVGVVNQVVTRRLGPVNYFTT